MTAIVLSSYPDVLKCQNPDEDCDRPAEPYRFWRRLVGTKLHLCFRCWRRFKRHKDGKQLKPWAAKKRPKEPKETT